MPRPIEHTEGASGYSLTSLIGRNLSIVLFALFGVIEGCIPPRPNVSGEVSSRLKKDTVLVEYDLTTIHTLFYRIDSVTFFCCANAYESLVPMTVEPDDSLMFQASANINDNYSSRFVDSVGSEVRMRGQFRYGFNHGSRPREFRVTIHGIGLWSHYDNSYPHTFEFDPPYKWSNGGIIGLGTGFIKKTHLPGSLSQATNAPIFSFAFGWARYNRHFNLSALASINTIGTLSGDPDSSSDSRNSFKDLLLDVRYQLGGRFSLWPKPHFGLRISRFEVTKRPAQFVLSEGGAYMGLSLDTDFERLTYKYNTHLGGFHQLDLLMGVKSNQVGKAGMMYSFYHGRNVRMFLVRLYLEGGGIRMPLSLRDNRSAVQKLMSAWALAPVYYLLAKKIMD